MSNPIIVKIILAGLALFTVFIFFSMMPYSLILVAIFALGLLLENSSRQIPQNNRETGPGKISYKRRDLGTRPDKSRKTFPSTPYEETQPNTITASEEFETKIVDYEEGSSKRQSRVIDYKSSSKEILALLKENHVRCLYHMTSRRNIESIKKHGGLYSWYGCKTRNITLAAPGGNQDSRRLDRKKGLEEYVRLSFVKYPPMYYVVQRDGRISDPIILQIEVCVACWAETLFSDKNACDNTAIIGGNFNDLQRVRFDLFSQRWKTDEEKKHYQAEVLVMNHIPLKFIRFPNII